MTGTEKIVKTVKKTLYRVLMVGGTSFNIDECPKVLTGEWADVMTYSQLVCRGPCARYVKYRVYNIHPSMIVGYTVLEDCEVVV